MSDDEDWATITGAGEMVDVAVWFNIDSDEEELGKVEVGIDFSSTEEEKKSSTGNEEVNLYNERYFVGEKLIYDGRSVYSYILSLKNMTDVCKNKLRMFKSLLLWSEPRLTHLRLMKSMMG